MVKNVRETSQKVMQYSEFPPPTFKRTDAPGMNVFNPAMTRMNVLYRLNYDNAM